MIDILKFAEAEMVFDPEAISYWHPLSKKLGIDFKNPAAGLLGPAIRGRCVK